VGDGVVISENYISVITDGSFRPFTHDEHRIGEHNYPGKVPLFSKDEGFSPA